MIIELDTVADGDYGDTGESAGRKITEGYAVTFTVVTEHGPGGGNPVIRYEGDADELRRMVAEHYGPDTVTDWFVESLEAHAEREAQVRHLLAATGVHSAALDTLVEAVVATWERDVRQVVETLEWVRAERRADAERWKLHQSQR